MRRLLAALLLCVTVLTLTPNPPSAKAYSATWRCSQHEPTYRAHAPKGGWDVRRMSYYSYRESRCIPGVVNVRGGDTGLFQIHPINWRWLASKFGMAYSYSGMRAWLKNPTNNTRAAAALCTFARRAWGDCYRPWRT